MDERIADIVAEGLHYRDGNVFRLDAYSVMPNHVHTVFKPLPLVQPVDLEDVNDPSHSLASIMMSLKGYTRIKPRFRIRTISLTESTICPYKRT